MANPKAKKRRKWILFAAIFAAAAALGVVAYVQKKTPAIIIQKEKVARRNLIELVEANGKIEPVVQVKISPEVSGEIIELPVKEGQNVRKGDLLVRIKADPYVASRNSAEANYKYSLASQVTAEANLAQADLEYKRNEELYRSKLVSDSAFLVTKTAYDVAKATLAGAIQQVEVAHSALARAEDDLSKTTIFSPLNGTVTKLNSEKGERVVGTAMMAGTEIMTVSDLNEMETRVDIGEIDVVLIKVGQVARLEVDAFKDREFKGEVTEIANSSKNNGVVTTGTTQDATKFEVKIRVAEKESFRPGMSVTAKIETRYRTNVLTVPIQSVTSRLPKEEKKAKTNVVEVAGSLPPKSADPADKKKSGEAPKPKDVVFLVEGDHVKMVPVKRGIADEKYWEITEGCQEGQEIVSGGYKAVNRELEDGKKVIVGDAKAGDKKEEK